MIEAVVLAEGGMALSPGADLVEIFEGLSTILNIIRADEIPRQKKSDIYNVEVLPGVSLADLLFQTETQYLDKDLKLALMVQVDALVDWDTAELQLVSSDVYVLSCLAEMKAAGLVVLGPHLGRRIRVHEGRSLVIHAIADGRSLTEFYREAPELGNLGAEEYILNASLAFRALVFKSKIAAEFRRFNEDYVSIREKVTRALAALNDHFHRIRISCNDDVPCIQQGFRGISGFEISRESPKTHKNRRAMATRSIEIGGRDLTCEWHVKLRPHIDRIHFHFGVPSLYGGRLIIGIFVDHLPT